MCDLDELLDFAEGYSVLRPVVQEQLHDLVDGDSDDVNPDAVAEIRMKLGGLNDRLDEILEEYFADETEA